MTAKEKAEELVEENQKILANHIFNGTYDIAIALSLACVDEKLKTLTLLEPSIGGRQNGKTRLSKEWLRLQQVKQEINKL